MKEYEVTVPIAGHAYMTVLANSEDEAIQKAIDEASLSEIETWQALRQFNEGNICFCPTPWEAEAAQVGGEEPEEEN